MSKVIQSTKQVIKATTSLDFMSNSSKADPSVFIKTIDSSLYHVPKLEPQLINSSKRPIHPFIQVNETDKLLSVMRKELKTAVTYSGQLTDGSTVYGNTLKFKTQRDALSFMDSIRDEYFELEVVPDVRIDYRVDSKPLEELEMILSEVNRETLIEALTTLMYDSQNHLFINEHKVVQIAKYITRENAAVIVQFIRDYITTVDNATIATNVTIETLRQLSSLSSKSQLFELSKQVYEALQAKYDVFPQVQTTLLQNLIKAKEPSEAYTILKQLSSQELSPSTTIMEQYLDLVVKKVRFHSKSNIEAIKLLQALDDLIYTTLSIGSLRSLLALCDNPSEITSIIDLTEMKFPDKLKELEQDIVKQLYKHKSGKLGHIVLKIGIVSRLQKSVELSQKSYEFVFWSSMKRGSLILARQLLPKMKLSPVDVEEVENMLEERWLNKEDSFPGRDQLSKRDFLEELHKQ
jgi:hypothetical protein